MARREVPTSPQHPGRPPCLMHPLGRGSADVGHDPSGRLWLYAGSDSLYSGRSGPASTGVSVAASRWWDGDEPNTVFMLHKHASPSSSSRESSAQTRFIPRSAVGFPKNRMAPVKPRRRSQSSRRAVSPHHQISRRWLEVLFWNSPDGSKTERDTYRQPTPRGLEPE